VLRFNFALVVFALVFLAVQLCCFNSKRPTHGFQSLMMNYVQCSSLMESLRSITRSSPTTLEIPRTRSSHLFSEENILDIGRKSPPHGWPP
jgi:hypothetical protein